MNTITNEGNYQINQSVRMTTVPTTKTGKISGRLSMAMAVLAMISAFIPFVSVFLFWNFLLLSAALSVFSFLETISAKNWMSSVTWLISLSLLLFLFVVAFDSLKNLQALGFYAEFSFIVPVLLMISAFTAKNPPVGKSLLPLIIPAFFILSLIFSNTGNAYFSIFLLPISWGLFGILNSWEAKN